MIALGEGPSRSDDGRQGSAARARLSSYDFGADVRSVRSPT